jgi:hypothetical protein
VLQNWPQLFPTTLHLVIYISNLWMEPTTMDLGVCIIKLFTAVTNFVMYKASLLIIVYNFLLALTNTLAFYMMELITAIKSFVVENRLILDCSFYKITKTKALRKQYKNKNKSILKCWTKTHTSLFFKSINEIWKSIFKKWTLNVFFSIE